MSMTIRVGDTYLSPTWAVVLDGAGVDLEADGWTVRAQARTRDGVLVIDFTVAGVVLFGTADVEVAGSPVTTSTIRLYLPPASTATLVPRETLAFDIEIENPTAGPLGDLYRVTLLRDSVAVIGDVTRAAA